MLKQNTCTCDTSLDTPSPTLNWKGFIRSMGKCNTYQNLYLPKKVLVPKWDQGWISTPWEAYFQSDEFVCALLCVCGGGWPIEESSESGLPEVEGRDVLQDLITYAERSCYFPRFLMRDGSLTQMNMASLVVLVMLCVSLLIMGMQSTLMECPVDWLCW